MGDNRRTHTFLAVTSPADSKIALQDLRMAVFQLQTQAGFDFTQPQ